MNKFIISLFYLFAGLLFVVSCNSNSDKFSIGDELVTSLTDVVSSDTATINFYTIKRDSIVTSGSGTALVGQYKDGMMGKVEASSYFEIQSSGQFTIENGTKLDSVTMDLYFNHKYYGDTSYVFNVRVYQIAQDLSKTPKDEGAWYNTSSVSKGVLRGAETIRARPSKTDRVQITLDKAFGQELFNLVDSNSTTISDAATFLKKYPGFALYGIGDSSILGFQVNDTVPRIRLHCSSGENVKNIDFKLYNSTYQFNRIQAERSGALTSLIKNYDAVSSSLTDHESLIQGGTALLTKLEFPGLRNLKQINPRVKLLSAVLRLYPVKQTYSLVRLPATLALYQTDALNNIVGTLSNSSGSAVTASVHSDYVYNEQSYYDFDITTYVNSIVSESSTDIPSIIVSVPTIGSSGTDFYTSLSRVVLADQHQGNNIPRLQVTYWRY
jgi:hypothetical protein